MRMRVQKGRNKSVATPGISNKQKENSHVINRSLGNFRFELDEVPFECELRMIVFSHSLQIFPIQMAKVQLRRAKEIDVKY
jgi:hypothetical protein